MSAAKSTIDHEEIRRWVEALRIDLPGQGVDTGLEPISWDEFVRGLN